jgi:hypothetical protein
MAVPSFISNFERSHPGAGVPWAVVLAVLLVVAVELAMHLIPTRSLLGYGEGLGTYYEVVHTVEEFGPAEVAIVGCSRGRETIVMPVLAGMLESRLGRSVYAANYSCPDARTSEMLLVGRLLTESATPPHILLYVISPRALLGNERSVMREEVFGVFPNEYGNSPATFLASFGERPLWEVRNMLQDNWLTFRHRYRVRSLLSSLPRGRWPMSPLQGDETKWQRYGRNRSLETHPVSDQQIHNYVARLLDDEGKYVLGDTHVAALSEIAQSCAESGTKLILVSAPISEDLARNMPVGVLERFSDLMEQFATENSVPFITSGDLGVTFGREDFREQSHLNRRGAEKMTAAIVDKVLMPILTRSGDQGAHRN